MFEKESGFLYRATKEGKRLAHAIFRLRTPPPSATPIRHYRQDPILSSHCVYGLYIYIHNSFLSARLFPAAAFFHSHSDFLLLIRRRERLAFLGAAALISTWRRCSYSLHFFFLSRLLSLWSARARALFQFPAEILYSHPISLASFSISLAVRRFFFHYLEFLLYIYTYINICAEQRRGGEQRNYRLVCFAHLAPAFSSLTWRIFI